MKSYDDKVKELYSAIESNDKSRINNVLSEDTEDVMKRFTKQVSHSPLYTAAVVLKKIDSLIQILEYCKDNDELQKTTRSAILEAIDTFSKNDSCSIESSTLENIREISRILLTRNSDKEYLSGYPNVLDKAIRNGDVSMIKLLLNNGIDKSMGYMNEYFTVGMYNIIKLHIDKDPNAVILGKTLIQHAIQFGNVKLIELLIKDGADVDRVSSEDQTPNIIKAVNNITILEKLIDAGANVNLSNDWKNALYHAVLQKKEKAVRLLLDNGAKPLPDDKGSSLIKYAIMGNDNLKYRYVVTKLLFERGVEITGDHEDYIKHIHGNETVYKKHILCNIDAYRLMNLLLENGLRIVDYNTPFYYLCNFNSLSMFKKLTANITDINKVGNGRVLEPFIIDNERVNLMKYLISIGANVEPKQEFKFPESEDIKYDIVKSKTLSKSRDSDDDDEIMLPNNLSLLFKAAYFLSYEKVRILLENGANVNAPCKACVTMMRKLYINGYFDTEEYDNDDEYEYDNNFIDQDKCDDKCYDYYYCSDKNEYDCVYEEEYYGDLIKTKNKEAVVNYLVSYLIWSGIMSQSVADSIEYKTNIELLETVPMLQYAKAACDMEINKMKNKIICRSPYLTLYDIITKDSRSEVKPCKLEISEQDINYISNKFKMFKSIIKLKLNEYMNKVNGI
ncbi:ankyrin repeat protein [Mudlarkpox virus]|nr:ankyrin repeat protein [Mudlarkpox virus]